MCYEETWVASWPTDILDSRLVRTWRCGFGQGLTGWDGNVLGRAVQPGPDTKPRSLLGGSDCTAGACPASPPSLSPSSFLLHLSWPCVPRQWGSAGEPEGLRGVSGPANKHLTGEARFCPEPSRQQQSVCPAFKQKGMMGEAQVTLTSVLAACQPYPSHCEHRWSSSPIRAPWTCPAAEARLPVYEGFLLPMWPVLCHLAGKEDLRDVLPLSDLPQRFFPP